MKTFETLELHYLGTHTPKALKTNSRSSKERKKLRRNPLQTLGTEMDITAPPSIGEYGDKDEPCRGILCACRPVQGHPTLWKEVSPGPYYNTASKGDQNIIARSAILIRGFERTRRMS